MDDADAMGSMKRQIQKARERVLLSSRLRGKVSLGYGAMAQLLKCCTVCGAAVPTHGAACLHLEGGDGFQWRLTESSGKPRLLLDISWTAIGALQMAFEPTSSCELPKETLFELRRELSESAAARRSSDAAAAAVAVAEAMEIVSMVGSPGVRGTPVMVESPRVRGTPVRGVAIHSSSSGVGAEVHMRTGNLSSTTPSHATPEPRTPGVCSQASPVRQWRPLLPAASPVQAAPPKRGLQYGPRNTCPVDTLLTVLLYGLPAEDLSEVLAKMGREPSLRNGAASLRASLKFVADGLDEKAKECWYEHMSGMSQRAGAPPTCTCSCGCAKCAAGLCRQCERCGCGKSRSTNWIMGHQFGIADQVGVFIAPDRSQLSPFHLRSQCEWRCPLTPSHVRVRPASTNIVCLQPGVVAALLADGVAAEVGTLTSAYLTRATPSNILCHLCSGPGDTNKFTGTTKFIGQVYPRLLLVEVVRPTGTNALAVELAVDEEMSVGGVTYTVCAVMYHRNAHWTATIVIDGQPRALYFYDGLVQRGTLRRIGASIPTAGSVGVVSCVLYRRRDQEAGNGRQSTATVLAGEAAAHSLRCEPCKDEGGGSVEDGGADEGGGVQGEVEGGGATNADTDAQDAELQEGLQAAIAASLGEGSRPPAAPLSEEEELSRTLAPSAQAHADAVEEEQDALAADVAASPVDRRNRTGGGAAREGAGADDSDSSSSSSSSIEGYRASRRSAKSSKSFDVRSCGPAPPPLLPHLPDVVWDLILGSTDSQVTQQTSTNRKVVEFFMMKAHRHILKSYTTWDEMTGCQQDSFLIGDCPIMTHWDAYPPPRHVQVCVCLSTATLSRLFDPRSHPWLARSGLQERIGAEFGFAHLRNLRHEEGEIQDGDTGTPLLQSIPNSGAFLTRLKADSSELAATIIYAWDHGGAKDRVLETEFGCPTSQSLLDQISSFLMYNAHEKSIAAQFTFGLRPPCPAALLRHFFCLAQWSICFSIPSLRMYSQLRRQLSDHRERLQTNPSWYSPVMWETSKLATKVREKLALEWVARRCSAEYGEDFFVWRGWPSSCPGCLDGRSFWSCQPTVVLVRQVPAPCSRAP